MNTSALSQGQKILAIWGAAGTDGSQYGGKVGRHGVNCIEISQCRGPMGFYDVAVINGDDFSAVIPIHMAEFIEVAPEEPS